ncbi:hypothetical protein IPG41_06425 [Candidatus Peregrinibacteria bacterium]|nr:MAG: hypothetical protein IPG41_06425 [Candidatus Peregrinibacteria bacterium]
MRSQEQKEKIKKVLLLAPLFVLYCFGSALTGIIGRVLFVEHLGTEYLPHTYVMGAILGSLLTLWISEKMKKISLAKLLLRLSIFGAVMFFGNYLWMSHEKTWSYTFFLVVSNAFYLILAGTALWRVAGTLNTLFESKSTFLYYSLAASAGGVLAGFISNTFEEKVGVAQLIVWVCISLLIAAFNLFWIEHRYSKQFEPDSEVKQVSKWESIKDEFNDFKKTRLAKLLLLILTIFNVVWWISDFEFQKIVGETLSEAEYSHFLGLLSMVNSVTLLVALIIQDKILKKAGVLNTLLMSPSLVLPTFVALFLLPIPSMAFLAAGMTSLVGYSIFTSSSISAYTALPHAIRSRVATFISGNSDSLAMLLAGTGLVVLNEWVSNAWIIGLACALLFINVLLILHTKKIYLQQVLLNLGSTNKIDVHGAIENLAEETYREVGVQEMMKLISWRNLDPETLRKMVFALGKMGNVKVIPSLLDLFKNHDAGIQYSIVETIHSFEHLNKKLKHLPFTRLNLIETYEKIFLEEEDTELKILILERLGDFDADNVITFLRNAVSDKNEAVSTKALAAMRYFHDRGIIPYVRPYLENEKPTTQAAAVISLWQFPELKPLLMKSFIQIMAGTSRDHILASLNMIGALQFAWEKSYAQKQISNEDSEIRQVAILTLLQLEDEGPIPVLLAALIEKKTESLFYARALKKIPIRMRKILFREVEKAGETAVKNCIDTLKATYLDFTKEIEILSNASTGVNFSHT